MEQNKISKYNKGQLQKLSNVIGLTERLLGIDNRNFHIVHIDDHHIVRNGLKKLLLEKLPNSKIEGFEDNYSAHYYIKQCLENNLNIDFIISDIMRPNHSGIQFAYEHRANEKNYTNRIPIILFSLQSKARRPEIIEVLDNHVVDVYIFKDDYEKVIEFIKSTTCLAK